MKISNETIEKWAERFNWTSASEYGERGYHVSQEGGYILLANWNDFHSKRGHAYNRIIAQMEDQGLELEWSDEWVVDHENNSKAYRTSSDSYGWEPATVYTEDGNLITPDDDMETWLEWAMDNCNLCITNAMVGGGLEAKMVEAGWERHPDDTDAAYETGWFPGQTDTPLKVYEAIKATGDDVAVVFTIVENSQFYIKWAAWTKEVEGERTALGHNHWSDDMNLEAVVASMGDSAVFFAFNTAFPEFNDLKMDGSAFDVESAGLDMEYTSWCIDWIENNTPVYWEDGEPWVADKANWPMGNIGEGINSDNDEKGGE